MNYITFLLGFVVGVLSLFLIYKLKFKELSNLRYHYLLAQEEQTRFVKDKVLQVELDLYNFKEYVSNTINKV